MCPPTPSPSLDTHCEGEERGKEKGEGGGGARGCFFCGRGRFFYEIACLFAAGSTASVVPAAAAFVALAAEEERLWLLCF